MIVIPVLLIIGVAVWGLVRTRRVVLRWQGLVHYISFPRLVIRTICSVGACMLLVIALSRPQWGADTTRVRGTGRAVLVALDVSRSMCAQDIRPSRITRAKEKIAELVTQLNADRVGLLVFSGDALVLCPLTTDYGAFRMFLDSAAVEAASSGTTSIGGALEKALGSFEDQKIAGTRLVVLFTDGEDFAGHVPDVFDKIRAAGVRVCIVGVGSPDGGPIPIYDQKGNQNGFLKDQDGSIVISRPQMGLMQELAQKTGGLFISSTSSHEDIVRVKKWIERFERTKLGEEQTAGGLKEQFFWFTGAALVLLILGWLL